MIQRQRESSTEQKLQKAGRRMHPSIEPALLHSDSVLCASFLLLRRSDSPVLGAL